MADEASLNGQKLPNHSHKYERTPGAVQASGGAINIANRGGKIVHRHKGLLWAEDTPGHTHEVVGRPGHLSEEQDG